VGWLKGIAIQGERGVCGPDDIRVEIIEKPIEDLPIPEALPDAVLPEASPIPEALSAAVLPVASPIPEALSASEASPIPEDLSAPVLPMDASQERLERSKNKERKMEEEHLGNEEEEQMMQEEAPKKTNKTRTPGTRVHRKIEKHKEGVELVKKMNEFFAGNFEEKQDAHVLCSEILTRFIEFLGDDISKLDKMLFLRHGKRYFKIMWPNAKNAQHKRQRCYLHVCLKK